eukprot:g1526.t1
MRRLPHTLAIDGEIAAAPGSLEAVGGIYSISVGNFSHFHSSWDLRRSRKDELRLLAGGRHPHRWLQEAFQKGGGIQCTRFEIHEHAYRKHSARSFVNVLRRHKRQNLRATDIARVYRGHRGRKIFYRLLLGRAALRIQAAWRRKQGSYALFLKKRAKAAREVMETEAAVLIQSLIRSYLARKIKQDLEHERLVRACIRIQCAWRRRSGMLSYHLKIVARRNAEEELQRLETAAIKVQSAWRKRQGQFALHLKRRAALAKKEEEAMRDRAASRIQMWYHRQCGNFAAQMKARAVVAVRREEKRRERAAVQLQAWYRGRIGKLGAHLKKRALQLERDEELAAVRIQVWWSHIVGNFAAKLHARAIMEKRRQEAEAMEYQKLLEAAAMRIQGAFRKSQASYSAFLLRRAKAQQELERLEQERAALRLQTWWLQIMGTFAARLKAMAEVDRKRYDKRRHVAAVKIQMWYHAMNGNFAARLKARAEVEVRREAVQKHRAALRIQAWWHKLMGSFAARLKAMAEVDRRRHDLERDQAAHKIQLFWHRVQGNFAARLKARAQMQLRREEIASEDAARKIQIWYTHQKMGYARAIIARAKVQERRESRRREDAARYIQIWFHRQSTNFAEHLRARAEVEARREEIARMKEEKLYEERLEAAALRVQSRWRTRKGQLALHLRKKAITNLSRLADDWTQHVDSFTLKPYWYSESLDLTVYFRPETYTPPGTWYAEWDTDNMCEYYVRISDGTTAWELPFGAELQEKPRPPRTPRVYLRINGYYRRKKKTIPSAAKAGHSQPLVRKGDLVKVKAWVGARVTQKNYLRYYAGKVISVNANGTYNILMEYGGKRTGVRRDQILLPEESTPPSSSRK